MIIARTPYRVSFFGGGTDYPDWYRREPGAVLSTTIDKYTYLSCRYLPPYLNIRHRVVWRHVEVVATYKDILHPVVRRGLPHLGFDDSVGVEIHYQGDLPARSGMGSSSTFAVAFIHAMTALQGRTASKHELAEKAIELERDVLREEVGDQDQFAAAFGGFNTIRFCSAAGTRIEPVMLLEERQRMLESNLMMFYTGVGRPSSEVAAAIVKNIGSRVVEMRRMRDMVDEAVSIVRAGDLDDFGRLLHDGWLLKRSLSPRVATPTVDEIYARACDAGALGGKLLGAGGSGFMLFYVQSERQPAVRAALRDLLYVPFRFESGGSTLIYSDNYDAVPVSSGV
jgi:D-glycero-alpha-D-manno-heptose-7-phosphate kinase